VTFYFTLHVSALAFVFTYVMLAFILNTLTYLLIRICVKALPFI